jgi:PKHD-type hydroxylase
MFLHIPEILNQEEISEILDFLSEHEFVDGKSTAGYSAKAVKDNLQLSKDAIGKQHIDKLVMEALRRNDNFRKSAFPKKISPPIYSQYKVGMEYGDHIDNAIIFNADQLRTDISITIFLSDPSSYDGGELCIALHSESLKFKLACGDAIIYPTSFIHCVRPVLRGTRLAIVSWIESSIRSPTHREILYELNQVRESLVKQAPNSRESLFTSKTYASLVRMWNEF